MQPYLLGIDIGTSKIAVVIVDAQARLLASATRQHDADRVAPGKVGEQHVKKLMDCIGLTIQELPGDLRARISAIGLTGQAHGVALFNRAGDALTNLITWQDERCNQDDFLSMIRQRTGYRLHSGYGCATLAWLAAHGQIPAETAYAASIQDYCLRYLTQLDGMITDPSIAASMGLFDLESKRWDEAAITALGIPRQILPEIRESGDLAGRVQPEPGSAWGLPSGIPVAVGLGDNQASLYATLKDPDKEIALTLGTGGQLSAVLPAGMSVKPYLMAETFEIRPYREQRHAAVAAVLCGGAAWMWLARFVEQSLADLHLEPLDQDDLFHHLNEAGLSATGDLLIAPNFLGERHQPALRGMIQGINLQNFTLGNLAKGVAKGIFHELKKMLPTEIFAGRERIVGSGNALRKNPLLQAMAEEVFGLPLQLASHREEAAIGAAMNAAEGLRAFQEARPDEG